MAPLGPRRAPAAAMMPGPTGRDPSDILTDVAARVVAIESAVDTAASYLEQIEGHFKEIMAGDEEARLFLTLTGRLLHSRELWPLWMLMIVQRETHRKAQ